MANFTPGPWEMARVDLLGMRFAVREKKDNGQVLVTHTFDGQEAEANALLMATAPEMYNALKMVHKACGPSEIWQGETRKFLAAIEKILSELDEDFDPQAPMKELIKG